MCHNTHTHTRTLGHTEREGVKRGCCVEIVRLRQLAGIGDDHSLVGLAGLAAPGLDLLDHVHALDDGAEHNVTVVQPRCLHGGDEELRSVGVGTGVGHRQGAGLQVLEGEVLVLELGAVNRLAAGAVVIGEVTALAHEVRDDAVEDRRLVAESLLAGAQSTEVLRCLRHNVAAQLKSNKEKRRNKYH